MVIDFGDRYLQLKDNEFVDSGSLNGDRVRYIQVTAIYRSLYSKYKARFSGSCLVTVIYRMTAIYRAVIYRFDCTCYIITVEPSPVGTPV